MTKHILGKLYKCRGRHSRIDKTPGERMRINSDGTITMFFYDRKKFMKRIIYGKTYV
jgi:hypothetical protein